MSNGESPASGDSRPSTKSTEEPSERASVVGTTAAATTEDDAETFTVARFCALVNDTIESAFPDEVWVRGAISGLTRSNNGHVYFDLVDPEIEVGRSTGAVVPVALFATSRHLVNRILRKAGGVRMHDGIEIRIRGRVTYYPPQGRVQLVMSLIDPQFTLGRMVVAREALLNKLRVEALLDRNQLVAFPELPLRIALVTSDGSAAYADFTEELTASDHPFRITLIDSRVQGLDAVPSITAAVRATDRLDVDVVAVVRGGGAKTDLVAFDHERVARAIAMCRHPVVVGVGHETDHSVADEVANLSAKTPTAAAVLLVDAVDRYRERVAVAAGRLATLTDLHLSRARHQLVTAGNRLVGATVRVVERQTMTLDHHTHRLRLAPERALAPADHRLILASTRLAGLDPASALQRGWTITRTSDGRLVRSIGDVGAGTGLVTTTMDGTVASTVNAGPDAISAGRSGSDTDTDTDTASRASQ